MRRRIKGILCVLLCLLCLSGCDAPFSLPRATEPRNLAQVSVLGVDKQGALVTAYAATQGRGGSAPVTFEATGNSLAAARLLTRDKGTENVGYAHVEDIVLSEAAAADYLTALLSYSFQNKEQSMESHLWVLRGGALDALFSMEDDLAKRLTVLKTGGEAGTSLSGCTLRQAASRLADDGALLLPALTLKDGVLSFDSYALLQDGAPVGYLEGELARGASILSGASVYWTRKMETDGGRPAIIELHSNGCRVKPTIRNGALLGLEIIGEVDGKLYETRTADEVSDLEEKVKTIVEQELRRAVSALQRMETDAAALRRKAGLSAPWHWGTIDAAWKDAFPTLPVSITVEARVTAGG